MASNLKSSPDYKCDVCPLRGMCWVLEMGIELVDKNKAAFTKILSRTNPNFPTPPVPDPCEDGNDYKERVDQYKGAVEAFVDEEIVRALKHMQRDCNRT